MNKQKTLAFLLSIFPVLVPALVPVQASTIKAAAYIIKDNKTGNVIASENANLSWTPASLTKLVTAMVVMDARTKLSKQVAISSYDQALGACGRGGDCIKAKPGVKFTVDGLFHAALLPSANNAASALARSTGFSRAQFVARMNRKARALGAAHSHFVEPTGMSAANVITASDYSKIVSAAFKYPYLRDVAQTNYFSLNSTNNSRYNQTVHNTDRLLTSNGLEVVGAKTGYLGSRSGYNFGAVVKTASGQELSVVVLGEEHMYYAYSDVQTLASLASADQLAVANFNPQN